MNAALLRWIAGLTLSVVLVAAPQATPGEIRHTLEQNGRTLDLEISNTFEPGMQDTLVAWIDFISASLLQVYGRWPRQHWQITVAPAAAAGSDPVPWAQVHRGEVDRVEFFTAPRASVEELRQAWTGYHELAHLLIPYRGWGESWFSEGLATYYQNILAARAGILTEQQMWQRLYEGFERGRGESRFLGTALTEVNANLRDEGGFMRVYWSGAWYFLAIDVRLRRQSGGEISLDSALEKLNACCAQRQMSVPEMVSKLDELNHVLLFQSLYEQLGPSTDLPDYNAIFASLGVSISEHRVHLQQEGPGARLRRRMAEPLGL